MEDFALHSFLQRWILTLMKRVKIAFDVLMLPFEIVAHVACLFSHAYTIVLDFAFHDTHFAQVFIKFRAACLLFVSYLFSKKKPLLG